MAQHRETLRQSEMSGQGLNASSGEGGLLHNVTGFRPGEHTVPPGAGRQATHDHFFSGSSASSIAHHSGALTYADEEARDKDSVQVRASAFCDEETGNHGILPSSESTMLQVGASDIPKETSKSVGKEGRDPDIQISGEDSSRPTRLVRMSDKALYSLIQLQERLLNVNQRVSSGMTVSHEEWEGLQQAARILRLKSGRSSQLEWEEEGPNVPDGPVE